MGVKASKWIKCISTQGNIRGVALQCTQLVQEMCARHGLGGLEGRALGEAVMGSLLIASYCKPGERANLNIQADGIVKQALVDAHPNGEVRGYVIGNSNPDRSPNLGPWGNGLLSVLRTKDREGERPYIGTVPLVTGHLAKDLTYYWAQSEQIPSAVGLVVNLEGDLVSSAGGFLVQALPGASDAEIKAIETHIHEIQSLAENVVSDGNPLNLLSQIFQSTAFMVLEEKDLHFKCSCSWERVNRALTLVGISELQAMVKDEYAIVHCDFCAKEYKVDAAALQKLIDQAASQNN